eukprot:3419642-Pyramimonas_sp.AAC.1
MARPEVRAKIAAGHRGKRKRCKVCGTFGHNLRTCPVMKELRAPDPPDPMDRGTPAVTVVEPKKPKKCGVCGQLGHNRRTCPQLGGVIDGAIGRIR